MIYHGIRVKLKEGVAPAEIEDAKRILSEQAEEIPSVLSHFSGRDCGGDYDWTTIVVFEDLDGYWDYLEHPAHIATEGVGAKLIVKMESFDVTDDPDPDFGAKIAALQQRHYEAHSSTREFIDGLSEHRGVSALP